MLKNNPPNRNDIAKLQNGALYIVRTISVVTGEARSAASAAASSAASVAREAPVCITSLAVSARTPPMTPAVLSGVKSHAVWRTAEAAAAAAGRVVVVEIDDGVLLFVLICRCGDLCSDIGGCGNGEGMCKG